MDVSIVINALQLVFFLSLPVLAAALLGALLAGVVQVVTQIEDHSISFFGKITGVLLILFVMSSYYSSELLEFTRRIWGGVDFYY